MKSFIFLFTLFFSLSSYAIIDMRNANYSDTWRDIFVPASGFNLEVKRTYNSRSLFNGIFGFGWCSNYETRLEVTAEGNLKIYECGGGQEITFTKKSFGPQDIYQTIKKIITEVKKRNPKISSKDLKQLKNDLKVDSFLREEFARQLHLHGLVTPNVKYLADGRANEYIMFKNNFFLRHLPDGSFQKFNKEGRLLKAFD
ncbi:MAG: cell wall-associated protein wapA, partial [Bdellovibrio sp.]